MGVTAAFYGFVSASILLRFIGSVGGVAAPLLALNQKPAAANK